ncbi:MAG: hypothetical protein ACXWC9_08010 [Pseudobdellovibrionaceae bacterium]
MGFILILFVCFLALNSFADCDSQMSDSAVVAEVMQLRSELPKIARISQVKKIINCDTMIATRLFKQSKVSSKDDCKEQFQTLNGPLNVYKEKTKDAVYCGGMSISGICNCILGSEDRLSVLYGNEKGESEALDFLKELELLNYNYLYKKTAEQIQQYGGDGELDESTIENMPTIVERLCSKYKFPTARKKIVAAIDQLQEKLSKSDVNKMIKAEISALQFPDGEDNSVSLGSEEWQLISAKDVIQKTSKSVAEIKKKKCL